MPDLTRSFSALTACALFAALGLCVAPAEAQRFGGGGGGIGPGSTVDGDIARGQGIFLNGLGSYNLNSARAGAINTDTFMRFNNYVYESIQIDLHNKYLHRQRHLENTIARKKEILKRHRDNPEPADVLSGDALNSVLQQLLDPAISPSNYRRTVVPIAGDTVRKIPFSLATKGATFSMERLVGKRLWPLALRGPDFAKERKAYEHAIDAAINEDVEGKLTGDAVRNLQGAIADIDLKVDQVIPQSQVEDYKQAKVYTRGLNEVPRILKERVVEQAIAAIETYPGTSVGDLILFMQKYDLRFARADSPSEREMYPTLFENLRLLRDQVGVAPARDNEEAK